MVADVFLRTFILTFLISLPVLAQKPEVCGRYLMVGQYSCEASSCKLTVYPGSISEMSFPMVKDNSPAVKNLTGKNVRGWVDLNSLDPKKVKGSFYHGAVMEYPIELGPRAFKLIKEERCVQ